MKVTKVEAKYNQKDRNNAANSAIAGGEEFNFDLWAKGVRQQMLSVLREKAEEWQLSVIVGAGLAKDS